MSLSGSYECTALKGQTSCKKDSVIIARDLRKYRVGLAGLLS